MGRARTRHAEKISRLLPPRKQSTVRDTERSPPVPVLEDETFIVHAPVPQDPPHAVRVRRPVCHSDRVRDLRIAILRGCRFCDDVVRYHPPRVAHVELARKVAVVRELVAAVAKSGPFFTDGFLASSV